MLPLLAIACLPEEPGREVQTAEPVLCLAPPSAAAPPEAGSAWSVAGYATGSTGADGGAFADGVRCERATRILTVSDDRGDWRVGYGWSVDGLDVTPAIALAPGDPVDLLFRASDGAAGLVLRSRGHLIAAIEVGVGGPALDDGDLPALVIGEGPVVGSETDACGRKVSREVRFVVDGADTASLEPVDDAAITFEGAPITAWALASWGWQDATCDQVEGELSWALWREP